MYPRLGTFAPAGSSGYSVCLMLNTSAVRASWGRRVNLTQCTVQHAMEFLRCGRHVRDVPATTFPGILPLPPVCLDDIARYRSQKLHRNAIFDHILRFSVVCPRVTVRIRADVAAWLLSRALLRLVFDWYFALLRVGLFWTRETLFLHGWFSPVIFNRCSVKDRQAFRRKFDKFD